MNLLLFVLLLIATICMLGLYIRGRHHTAAEPMEFVRKMHEEHDEYMQKFGFGKPAQPRPRTDAERYQWLRVLLCGLKWDDTPLERIKPEDAKYITPSGLNGAIDAALERESKL